MDFFLFFFRGKTLVHEFAKLRWGVFEEHGYPGDSKFPMYYMKAVWSPEGQKATVTPNFCVNGELRGYEQVCNKLLCISTCININ